MTTRTDPAASDGTECHRNHHPTATQAIQERPHPAAAGARGSPGAGLHGRRCRRAGITHPPTPPTTIAGWSGCRRACRSRHPPRSRCRRDDRGGPSRTRRDQHDDREGPSHTRRDQHDDREGPSHTRRGQRDDWEGASHTRRGRTPGGLHLHPANPQLAEPAFAGLHSVWPQRGSPQRATARPAEMRLARVASAASGPG